MLSDDDYLWAGSRQFSTLQVDHVLMCSLTVKFLGAIHFSGGTKRTGAVSGDNINRMYMAVAGNNSSPSVSVTIVVALIAAVASVIAAVIAARSAGSSKRLEVQTQRIRDLESRISERKYKVYEPFLEMIGNFFDLTDKGRAAIADPKANVEGFVEFSKQITTYGSDEVVEAYHKFNLATTNGAPFFILARLIADFLLAVRKDLSYPDTKLSGMTLIATTFRVNDFYQQGDDFHKIMTLPLHEACRIAMWSEPWVFSAQLAGSQPPNSSQVAPSGDPTTS